MRRMRGTGKIVKWKSGKMNRPYEPKFRPIQLHTDVYNDVNFYKVNMIKVCLYYGNIYATVKWCVVFMDRAGDAVYH